MKSKILFISGAIFILIITLTFWGLAIPIFRFNISNILLLFACLLSGVASVIPHGGLLRNRWTTSCTFAVIGILLFLTEFQRKSDAEIMECKKVISDEINKDANSTQKLNKWHERELLQIEDLPIGDRVQARARLYVEYDRKCRELEKQTSDNMAAALGSAKVK